MAGGVFKGLLAGLGLGLAAAAAVSLAVPGSPSLQGEPEAATRAGDEGAAPEPTIRPSGLPRLRSETARPDPDRPAVR